MPLSEMEANLAPWKILVCGSRTWAGSWKPRHRFGSSQEKRERDSLIGLLAYHLVAAEESFANDGAGIVIELIHGGCPTGADRIADHWAKRQPGVKIRECPANWSEHGRRAGPIRNKQMVDMLDPAMGHHQFVIAAWDGQSAGTRSTVKFAKQRGIDVVQLLRED